MALKAGLVGVNPKGVDKNGMPKTDTAAISAEVDAIAANLKANNKDFVFAYDGTSQKYGYKAGADGDFVPFDSGAAGGPGWVAPDNLITTGLSYSKLSYIAGGYYHDIENHICYIDIILKKTTSGSGYMIGLPRTTSNDMYALANVGMSDNSDNYFGTISYKISIQSATTAGIENLSTDTDTYIHIFGMYSTS